MAATMTQTMAARESYAAAFERFAAQQDGKGPSWLAPLRRAAISRFHEVGFPTRHDEEWRFTNPAPLAEATFSLAGRDRSAVTPERLRPFIFPALSGAQLVFVNGVYAPELSRLQALPPGVQVRSLAEALAIEPALVEPHLARHAGSEQQAFVALNTAFLSDGASVSIPRNAVVETPIHLLYVASATGEPTVSHPRTLLVAGENSQATVIEHYLGLEESIYFTNAVTEVVLAENAVLDHYKLQQESRQAFHVATMQVRLERSSNFASHSIALGGGFVRNDVNALLGAEGIECTLNGLYLADGRRLIDNHTVIDHAMPHCDSHELYKGILDGRAHGVFNGKIFVRQDAQKTDAKQTNKTLLLSEDAQINTKPQLEIFADDVKCTHGATVGQLDAEALFYLRTRGIGERDARNLLIYAFASDIISRIKVEPIRAQLDAILLAQLPKG
jgi:Fe-S cluster assembly protein SufD